MASPLRIRATLWRRLVRLGVIASGLIPAFAAAQDSAIAQLQQMQGDVLLVRSGISRTARPGEPLHRSDRLESSSDGRAAVAFIDGSRMVLGGDGVLVVEEVTPAQGRQRANLILSVPAGAFRLFMPELASGAGRSAIVRTPKAVLSAAKGEIWAGPNGQGVAVLAVYGRLEVRNSAGSLVLTKKRSATQIASHFGPPAAPKEWGRPDVEAALMSVAFD